MKEINDSSVCYEKKRDKTIKYEKDKERNRKIR